MKLRLQHLVPYMYGFVRKRIICIVISIILLLLFGLALQEYIRQQLHGKSRSVDNNETTALIRQVKRPDYGVNCRLLIEWDENEHRRAKLLLRNLTHIKPHKHVPLLPDQNFVFESKHCNIFRQSRGYDTYAIHELERNFSLAFIILTYQDVEQLERLLRIIYRPQNAYCIHVDSKSTPVFRQAVESVVSCFDNVFVASRLEKIVYAGFSRLRADINCMEDLTRKSGVKGKKLPTAWKYVLNMASSEFPLRTNYELARIFHMMNGANDIEIMKSFPKDRTKYKWIARKRYNSSSEYMVKTSELNSPAPHNYTLVKGITYCAFSRAFVEYALTNVFAKSLLRWAEDTFSPDEWYWATLQYNTQFKPPGGFKGHSYTRARFIGWKGTYPCLGEMRHNICVFSFQDLSELVTRKEYVANKFLLAFDPIGYQCLEEWMTRRVSLQQNLDIIYYCRIPSLSQYSINPTCARLIKSK